MSQGGKNDAKKAVRRAAAHLQSSCLSEFLTYCVTAEVSDHTTALVVKTSHSDAQTQVRICSNSQQEGREMELSGHTDPHGENVHSSSFISTKTHTHGPAFDQNVGNFTWKPDVSCGHFNGLNFCSPRRRLMWDITDQAGLCFYPFESCLWKFEISWLPCHIQSAASFLSWPLYEDRHSMGDFMYSTV